jgi:ATP-dependent Clp protease adaptor protein ClpS
MSETRRHHAKPTAAPTTETQDQGRVQQLPPFKVMLHNDDVNEMSYVVRSILEVTHLSKQEATQRMIEAHQRGVALLLTTHKERAELYVEQFAGKGLTTSMEPA